MFPVNQLLIAPFYYPASSPDTSKCFDGGSVGVSSLDIPYLNTCVPAVFVIVAGRWSSYQSAEPRGQALGFWVKGRVFRQQDGRSRQGCKLLFAV